MLKRLLAGLLIPLLAGPACAPRFADARLSPQPPATTSPDAPRGPEVWRRLAQRLAPGSGVRILLTDGTRMRAVFLAAEDADLVVKRKTRLPEPEQRIAYGSLELLELENAGGMSVGKAVAIGVGTGAATFLGMILMAFALLDD
jgi:hypothetical protein